MPRRADEPPFSAPRGPAAGPDTCAPPGHASRRRTSQVHPWLQSPCWIGASPTPRAIQGVAFSGDGMTLAGGSWDRKIRLWDVRTGRTLGSPLRGQDNRVSGVAFSPDGKTLASASADRTVRLWDVRSRRAVGEPLRGHEGEVNAVAFSPDGKTLASASADKTVALWELDLPWTSEACRLANRSLSRAEWDEFVGKRTPYVRTCPAFPSGQGAPPDAPAARMKFTSGLFTADDERRVP